MSAPVRVVVPMRKTVLLMPDPSYARHGRSVMKREAAELAEQAEKYQAAVVAANRERLRMDAHAVDPTLLEGAQAVFVRGRGWFYLVRVSAKTATVSGGYGFGKERVPLNQIVDFR